MVYIVQSINTCFHLLHVLSLIMDNFFTGHSQQVKRDEKKPYEWSFPTERPAQCCSGYGRYIIKYLDYLLKKLLITISIHFKFNIKH